MPSSVGAVAVVDAFCGIGGLAHGFYKEGFKICAGIDIDSSCRFPFETNNEARFINKSIEKVSPDEISSLFAQGEMKILIGCAPCQQFSMYTRRNGKYHKWELLRSFSRLVSEIRPEIVSMENVPQILHQREFKKFTAQLRRDGYTVSQYVVFCPDYGIPQRRRRLVLLASLFGKVKLIEKTRSPKSYRTLKDAIYKMRPIAAGEVDRNDPLHRSMNLSPLNMARIRSTPEGGGWQAWDDSIKLACHKKETGVSFRAVYGRMRWDRPASTITTEFGKLGSGRFGHPVQDRAISIREAALLQTFPKYYRFYENKSDITFARLSRHIGNAVPVTLGRVIAKSIRAHLESVSCG